MDRADKPAAQRLKDLFGSLFSSAPAEAEEEDGKAKYTPERLQQLYETLHRHPVINDANKAIVVETVRSIAEFMIWGDQHEPRIFDFFLENNIMVRVHRLGESMAFHSLRHGRYYASISISSKSH